MHSKGVLSLCLAVLLLSATACNPGIFFDEEEVLENMSVTVGGDGGEVSFAIPTGHLLRLGFGILTVNPNYVTYYDMCGDTISPDSPAEDIASIVYSSDFVRFEIIKNDNVLKLRSVYNTIGRECDWPIWLEYDFGYRNINAVSLPGLPLSLVDTEYADDFTMLENARTSETRLRVANNSPSSTLVGVQPYLNAVASVLVGPTGDSNWIKSQKLDMPVPVYSDGAWKLSSRQIDPDVRFTYDIPDRKIKEEVTIPPYSDMNVITRVNYSAVMGHGTLHFLNQVSGVHLYAGFEVTSLYPMSYDIFLEKVPAD